MQPWLAVPPGSDFTVHNIPFGAGRHRPSGRCSLYTRLGDSLVDLAQLQAAGAFADLPEGGRCFQQATLNSFMSLGRPAWRQTRTELQRLLTDPGSPLAGNAELRATAVLDQASCNRHTALQVLWLRSSRSTAGRGRDGLASRHRRLHRHVLLEPARSCYFMLAAHLTEVLLQTSMLPESMPQRVALSCAGPTTRSCRTGGLCCTARESARRPLTAEGCRVHLPVAYHGRCSSIVVSGTPVRRPR